MKETIFKIFDTFTEGVDTYYHNGSMWLIFTNEQRWIIELAQDGILWYNSFFFGDCLKYVSLDVVENQHYITEWVENIIQNGVKSTLFLKSEQNRQVENTIINGVKSTQADIMVERDSVEDTIQNGVKETTAMDENRDMSQKDGFWWGNPRTVNLENIVKEGIKELKGDGNAWIDEVSEIIDKGIKETHEDVFQSNARVWGVVNNGIKQTIELPDMSGQLISYGKYYARQKDKTYPHDDIVNDVINGK